MAEAIIGREHGTNRLIMRINNQAYALSTPGSAPKTVSSTHCRLLISEKRELTLSNIKSQLNTYVDGIQINSKHITFQSRVELGEDHFPVDMAMVQKVIDQVLPASYSIKHLEDVWEWYLSSNKEIVLKEQKRNNIRNLQGAFMTIGMLIMILPEILKNEFPQIMEADFAPYINALRFILGIPAVAIPIYFYIRGLNQKNQLVVQQDRLKKEFERKYVCPNPKCNRFMGSIPYSQLKYTQKCSNPECGCHYTYK